MDPNEPQHNPDEDDLEELEGEETPHPLDDDEDPVVDDEDEDVDEANAFEDEEKPSPLP